MQHIRAHIIEQMTTPFIPQLNIIQRVFFTKPALKTQSKSHSESTANHLAPLWQSAVHNHLTVTKHLLKTNVLQHPANTIDQILITYTKAFKRDSLKAIQNKVKNATATESTELFDILLKIKNLSEADETLVTKVLYETIEIMNEVNVDFTFSESKMVWTETILKHFEQMLQQEQLGTPITDIYKTLTVADDIEQNFDAVKMFWSKL